MFPITLLPVTKQVYIRKGIMNIYQTLSLEGYLFHFNFFNFWKGKNYRAFIEIHIPYLLTHINPFFPLTAEYDLSDFNVFLS
jgi:hypothetical protein